MVQSSRNSYFSVLGHTSLFNTSFENKNIKEPNMRGFSSIRKTMRKLFTIVENLSITIVPCSRAAIESPMKVVDLLPVIDVIDAVDVLNAIDGVACCFP